jgi:uncharacterized protein with gpF-like domain
VKQGPAFDIGSIAPDQEYINPFELEARELVALIEAKSPPRTIDSWRDIGAEEYARSFTAARTMGHDVVHDLYEGLLATLRTSGETEMDFADRVIPVLRQKGWLPHLTDQQMATRVLLIYDTNLRVSQAVGRWDRFQKNKVALPYLLGFTAKDERVRHPPESPESDHRAYDGILLPVDHPFWLRYFAPLGFRCRCQVVQKTRSQAARMGGATSELELANRVARLGEPWGFNPADRPLRSVEEAAEATNQERLEGAPPISVELERGRAAALWNQLVGQTTSEVLEALIQKIFG